MSLLGDVLGGVCKVGFAIGKAVVSQAWDQAQEANKVRQNSRGMSDRDLYNGAMNKNNSLATRMGYAQAYKDRHQK